MNNPSMHNLQSLPDQSSSFCAHIRSAAEGIMRDAVFVKINHDKINDYAGMLLSKYALIEKLDPQPHFVSEVSPEQTARYILALDSINFGSGYFKIAQKHGVALEYDVIAGGLKQAFLQSRMNTPEIWEKVTAADMHALFSIPFGLDQKLDTLMSDFSASLHVSGEILLREYQGSVLRLIESANGSAETLAQTVAAWPNFQDEPFYKRAQIFAADIHLALQKPISGLTMFADNMVPHVLRCDGILSYDSSLAARIDAGEEIVAGSQEEQEIRAAGLWAVELIAKAAGAGITAVNIDHLLWHRGYEPELQQTCPHRTLTTAY